MSRPIRERLTTAAELLQKAGDRLEQEQRPEEAAAHYEAANDVRAILQPAGWTVLRAEPGTGSSGDTNLAISLPETFKRQLAAAANDMGVSMSAVVRDGYRAVLEGRWLPAKPLRVRRRPDAKPIVTKNLNVRVPQDLLDQVKALLPELSETLGYRVSMGNIAAAWLAEELGVDRPTAEDASKLKLVTSKRRVDYWLAEAEQRGVPVNDIVADGIRDVLAGEETLEFTEWLTVSERPREETGKWTFEDQTGPKEQTQRGKLSLVLPDGLLAQLRDWCADQSVTAEWPVYPAMCGIAILKNRLGEPPAE